MRYGSTNVIFVFNEYVLFNIRVAESCKSGFPSLCSPVVPLQKSFSNQDKRHTTRIFPESGTSISANHLYPTNFNHTLSQVPSRTFSDVQKKDIINDSLEVNGTNERSSRILNVPVPFSQDKANYMTESLGLTSNCRTPEVATPVKNSKFTFRPAVSSLSVLPTNDQRRPSNKMSNRHPNDLSTSRSSFDDHLWTDGN